MRRLIPSPALIVACLALALSGAGAGYAAGQITTRDIADDAVTSAKIHDGAITGDQLRGNAVTGDKVAAGSIQTSDLSSSTVRGLRVRAWTSVVVSPHIAMESKRTRGFAKLTHPATGVYCLTLSDSSIDPATTAPQVTVDWDNSAGANLLAYLSKSAFQCPAGTDIGVRTFTFKPRKRTTPTNTVAFTVVVP